MNLAVIPARGGSKRLPGKNIRAFNGKPMLWYAIEIARKSGLFENIIVSTDDEHIARIAREGGAETPFMRPEELADDHAITVSVMAHAIDYVSSTGESYPYVCCLYPCVPLLEAGDLVKGYEMIRKTETGFCFPVAEFPSAVQRAMKMNDKGKLDPLYPEYSEVRTQDLDKAWYDAGQFYWARPEAWLNHDVIHGNAVGVPVPAWRAVDIDTEQDWQYAEKLAAALQTGEQHT